MWTFCMRASAHVSVGRSTPGLPALGAAAGDGEAVGHLFGCGAAARGEAMSYEKTGSAPPQSVRFL